MPYTFFFFFLHVTRATDRHLPLKSMCTLFCISCLSADLSSFLWSVCSYFDVGVLDWLSNCYFYHTWEKLGVQHSLKLMQPGKFACQKLRWNCLVRHPELGVTTASPIIVQFYSTVWLILKTQQACILAWKERLKGFLELWLYVHMYWCNWKSEVKKIL